MENFVLIFLLINFMKFRALVLHNCSKIKIKNAKQGKFHPTDTSLNRLDSRSSCSHIQHNPDSVLSSVFDGLVEHNMHAVCEDC